MIESQEILQTLKNEVEKVETKNDLQVLKSQYFGKKGLVGSLMKKMKDIPNEEKKAYGQEVNVLKGQLQEVLNDKLDKLNKKEREILENKNWVDVTLPGAKRYVGRENLLMKVYREAEDVFNSIGFDVVEGPEIEEKWFNFDALNTPEWHPARDVQDTFYLDTETELLLRTQTSPVQIRTMKKVKPPIAIVSPGRVFRKDEIDSTHSPVFHQLECLYVDKNVTVGHLKKVLELFVKKIFGEEKKVLLRPSYFPFVEPGFEVDVSCFCGGKGCSICKNSGWIEVLGAGLVHPNVIRNAGYDPEKWQGFAFGVGLERIAMLKYGVTNLRDFYRNDIRNIELGGNNK